MTSNTKKFLWAFIALLTLTGCKDLGYVEKAKYDNLLKENEQLRAQLLKEAETPRHHYSLHREGLRTFRFDADTGDTCILLTTDADWKRPDTKAQSCGCSDFLERNSNPSDTLYKFYCGS